MGSYKIVIGKKDGKIRVDGKGFTELGCLRFLENLKLGDLIEEKFKAYERHPAYRHLVSQTISSDDDSKTG